MARAQQTASKVNGKNASSVDKLIAARNEMRARKEAEAAKAKPAVTRKPRAKATVVEEPQTPEAKFTRLMGLVNDYLDDFEVPSWKRTACAFVVSVALAAGAGWLIGQVIGYAMIGALAITGSIALAWFIFAIGLLLSAYVGLKIGQKVGGYILSGDIDRDASRAWGWVKGKFAREPKLVAA